MISRKKAKISPGWLVVAVSTLVMFGFYGTSGSFGVFLKPIVATFGSTRAGTSGAMSTFMVLTGLIGIIAGRITDKYGARVVISGGALLGTLGYLLTYQVSSFWQLHLYFGVMVGISMGACFTPVIATVSKLFTEKRVLAVGITTTGIALGQMTIPLLAAQFIAGYGWRPAFFLMGIIVLITAIPATIWLRKSPPQSNHTPTGNDMVVPSQPKAWTALKAVRTLPFWMFIVVGFVTATGFYFVLVHVVPYATDTGITATTAALILTVFNGGMIAAQFLVWFLTKNIGSRFTIVIMLGLQALALFLLMGVTSFYMLIVLGIVYGFGFGGSNTIRLSMIAEIFGTRSTGEILGLISVAWAAGGIAGPILAGYIFDLSQSYDIAFLSSGLLLAVGAVSGFFLKAPDG